MSDEADELRSIAEPLPPSAEPDLQTRFGLLQLDVGEEDLARAKEERRLRRWFLIGGATAVVGWGMFVACTLARDASRYGTSKEEAVAMIASVATLGVGGTVAVMRYLFPQK